MTDKYKYLVVDKDGYLSVVFPIMSGDTIGLDNTCQSDKEIKNFFYGKKRIMVEENGISIEKEVDDNVYSSLNNLRNDIHNKYIKIYNSYEHILIFKNILNQITEYENTLKDIKPWADQTFNSEHSIIPREVLMTLAQDQSIGVIGLDPKSRDNLVRFRGLSDCTFGIRNFEGRTEQILSTKLREYFKDKKEDIEEKHNSWLGATEQDDNRTWKENVLTELNEMQNLKDTTVSSDVLLQRILNALKAKFAEVRSVHNPENLFRYSLKDQGYLGDINNNSKICEYFKNLLFLQEDESLDYGIFMNYIKSLIQWDDLEVVAEEEKEVFEKIHESGHDFKGNSNAQVMYEERMSVGVQFLIGIANIVLKRKGKTREDFGMIIEGVYVEEGMKKSGRKDMMTSLFDHINGQLNIEGVSLINNFEKIILDWISHNHLALGITKDIETDDMIEIIKVFRSNFLTIIASPHFDEFLLRAEHGNMWKNIEGLIATDLRNVLSIGFQQSGLMAKDLENSLRYLQMNHYLSGVEIDDSLNLKMFDEIIKNINTTEPDIIDQWFIAHVIKKSKDGTNGLLGFDYVLWGLNDEIILDVLNDFIVSNRTDLLKYFLGSVPDKGKLDSVIDELMHSSISQKKFEAFKCIYDVKNSINRDSLNQLIQSNLIKLLNDRSYDMLSYDLNHKTEDTHLQKMLSRSVLTHWVNKKVIAAADYIDANHDFVKKVISYACIEDNSDDITRFIVKALNNNQSSLVIQMIDAGVDLSKFKPQDESILMMAINKKNNEVVDKILESNMVNVNYCSPSKGTALKRAVVLKDVSLVEKLCQKGADVNLMGRNEKIPILHYAISVGDIEMIKVLLKNDVNCLVHDSEGIGAITYAINEGKLSILELIWNDSYVISDGDVIKAVESGDPKVLKFLLDRGANVHAIKPGGLFSPESNLLDIALDEKNSPMIKVILNHSYQVDSEKIASQFKKYFNSIDKNDSQKESLEIMIAFLKAGLDPNITGTFHRYRYFLDWATDKGYEEIIKESIKKENVNVDVKYLIASIEKGHVAIFDELINVMPDLDLRYGKYNRTALIVAAKEGRVEMAEKLIKKGANLDIVDKCSDTALLWAVERRHFNIVKILIKNGADLNVIDEFGYTALMNAVEKGYTDTIQELIDAGADINIKNNEGDNAYNIAAKKGHNKILDLIKNRSAIQVQKRFRGSLARLSIEKLKISENEQKSKEQKSNKRNKNVFK